ncbi:MAG TPA: hypothetical protein VK525_15050 [Candidatus Saccharimonadales bacterium]|nr:hypothetical protein [Candidatus Saccharimonadales bacterium]
MSEKTIYVKSPKLWWLQWLEVGALAAGIVYAFLTYLMWSDSHKNFRIEHQATLNPVIGLMPLDQYVVGNTLHADVNIVNVGQTAAKHNISDFVVTLQSNASSVQIDYKRGVHTTGGLLSGLGGINPIAVIRPLSAYAADKLKEEEVEGIKAGSLYVAVYGRGEFVDIYGDKHWFKICVFRGYNEKYLVQAKSCTDYNDVGDGELPPG